MWSDKETKLDLLGFDSYVEVLSELCQHPELAPLCLGVFGSWGSGKSSLMQMIKANIDEEGNQDNLTLWFNAWRYEGKEEAQSALIHAIIGQMEAKRTIGDEAKELIKSVVSGASVLKLSKFIYKTATTMTPDITGFLDIFSDESKKLADTMENFDKRFEALLNSVGIKRVIVFVDDLDRCSSAKVIETFETIKLFLNTPSCTFVVGADAERIESAVAEVYSLSGADQKRKRDYLEKIVQIPFNIPQQQPQDIGAYIALLLLCKDANEELRKEIATERVGIVSAEDLPGHCRTWAETNKSRLGDGFAATQADMEAILPHTAIVGGGLKGNPRQIKRFLNVLSVRRRLATANRLETKPDVLVKLTAIEYVWEEFFKSVVGTVNPATGISELLQALLADDSIGDAVQHSPLLAQSLDEGGLIGFLKQEPQLASDLDLRPYMFLAQTSLSRQPLKQPSTVSDKVKELVGGIENEDRIVSRAAALRAAAEEPAIIESVFKSLVQRFETLSVQSVQTHVVIAFGLLAEKRADLYPGLLKFLAESKKLPPAASIFIPALLQKAEAAGNSVDQKLKDQFKGGLKEIVKPKGKS
jgi:hypothetical protein